MRPPAADSGVAVPFTVEWAGCAGVRKGPICELGKERRLTLWVDHAGGTQWSVVTNRGRVAAKIENDIDGGTRLLAEIPVGSRRVEIRDGDDRAHWSLTVAEVKAHEEIDRLVALGRTGKYEEAFRTLETLRASASDDDKGPTDAAIGRMALPLGKVDRAEKAFRASIAAAKAEGRIGDMMKDGSALFWALVQKQQRFVDARALLDEMKPFGNQYPEGRVWVDYDTGQLAAVTADVRTALEEYRAAERRGRRLDLAVLAETSSMEVAHQLTRIGRADEGARLLKTLSIPEDSCARASQILNSAWILMERASQLQSGRRDPEVADALARADDATRSCPDPYRRLLTVINRAEYALETGDDDEVAQVLQTLRTAPPDRDVLLTSWRADVLGRYFLRQRKPQQALAAFQTQVDAALGAGLQEEAFRGRVGAGRALLALGRRNAAVSDLKLAQKQLEAMLRVIPIAEGRGSFLSGHDEGIRYLVSALVDGGATRDALRVARWARAAEINYAARIDRLAHLLPEGRRRWEEVLGGYRRIRAEIELEAQNDWKVPRAELTRLRTDRQRRSDEARSVLDDAYRLIENESDSDFQLSEPANGEVILAFFPGPQDWYVFAASPNAVNVQRIEDATLSSPAGPARVLALFGLQLAAARRVRLLPYGVSDRVDWHVIEWNGLPLLASLEVEYGLDIPSRSKRHHPEDAPSTALIIANPSGDLSSAIPEADAVAHALVGWHVTRLNQSDATRESVLAALSRSKLFHYAGHAEANGSQGLSNALLLKGNARLELADVLAVAAVPDIVVLSACEAAGTAVRYPSLMGLAQGFIAAGAQAAVASTRPISDSAARTFMQAFYPALVGAKSAAAESVRAAFRRAAMTVSAVQDTPRAADVAGWESFRLLVP